MDSSRPASLFWLGSRCRIPKFNLIRYRYSQVMSSQAIARRYPIFYIHKESFGKQPIQKNSAFLGIHKGDYTNFLSVRQEIPKDKRGLAIDITPAGTPDNCSKSKLINYLYCYLDWVPKKSCSKIIFTINDKPLPLRVIGPFNQSSFFGYIGCKSCWIIISISSVQHH